MQTKFCEQCGKEFPKPRTSSRKSWEKRRFCSYKCKGDSQKGSMPKYLKPYAFKQGHVPTNKGIRVSGDYVSCAICKTIFYRSNSNIMTCGNPLCKQQYRKNIVNPKISRRAKEDYASGKRISAFAKIPGARNPGSQPSEKRMKELLEPLGWTNEFIVRTGLPRKKGNALYYRVDFAKPNHRLYVELDGSIHHTTRQKERDARRDRVLSKLGWKGLRILEQDFLEDPKATIDKIVAFFYSS